METNGKRQRCGRGGGRGRCGRGAGSRPQSCPGRQGPYPGYFPFGAFGGQGPFQGCPFGGPPQQQPKEKKTETQQPKDDVPTKDTESAKEKEVPMTTEVNKEASLKVNIIFFFYLILHCNYYLTR